MSTKKTIDWVDSEDKKEAMREVVRKTPKGKEIKIERDVHGLWFVSFATGGELPKKLQGRWTRRPDVIDVIDEYLANG